MSGSPGVTRTRATSVNSRLLCQLSYRGPSLPILGHQPSDLPERFARKILVTEGGCWRFTGAKSSNGYGSVGYRSRVWSAHKLAYTMLVGTVPDGLTLDHLCHNRDLDCPGGRTCEHRACCNPEHLEPVPQRVNSARSPNTLYGATHCPRGHSYATAYVRPNGRRECRECRDEKRPTYYERERAQYAARVAAGLDPRAPRLIT